MVQKSSVKKRCFAAVVSKGVGVGDAVGCGGESVDTPRLYAFSSLASSAASVAWMREEEEVHHSRRRLTQTRNQLTP